MGCFKLKQSIKRRARKIGAGSVLKQPIRTVSGVISAPVDGHCSGMWAKLWRSAARNAGRQPSSTASSCTMPTLLESSFDFSAHRPAATMNYHHRWMQTVQWSFSQHFHSAVSKTLLHLSGKDLWERFFYLWSPTCDLITLSHFGHNKALDVIVHVVSPLSLLSSPLSTGLIKAGFRWWHLGLCGLNDAFW